MDGLRTFPLVVLELVWALNAAVHTAAVPVPRLLHFCDCPAPMAAEERAELQAAFGKPGCV